LRELEIAEKAVLVVNRAEKRMELSAKQIESTVDLPVFATFPNDYAGVTRAIRKAQQPSPRLAASARRFAKHLGGRTGDAPPKRTFIEFFHLKTVRRWANRPEPAPADESALV
jgi:Flp pilus assembly CpaE family ATPase